MNKLIGGFGLLWLAFAIGWVANVVQVFTTMPASFDGMAPMYIAKVICIFIAPVGSVLGWIGMF